MAGEPILIVEDNPGNLKLAITLFSKLGYEVRVASNAKEALNILVEFQPRLILMDLQLPGMSGLDLTRKLKADPKYKNVLIIAITAYAMKGDKEKALAAGCDGYVTKPIDVDTLPMTIKEFLATTNTVS